MIVRTILAHHGHNSLNEGLTAHKYRFQYEEIRIHCIINIRATLSTMVPPREQWQLKRSKPQGLELFEAIPKIKDIFVKAEWYDFLCTFEGNHTSLAMMLAKTFDGF